MEMRSLSDAMKPVFGKPVDKKVPGIIKIKTRPLMRSRGKYVWSGCTVIDHDGSHISGWYETCWGTWFYFARVGDDEVRHWYKGRIDEFRDFGTIAIEPDLRHHRPRD